MGSTGYSTGTHLHFELLFGGSTVDPWDYLPAGMVTIKPAKHAKHGKHKHGGRKHGGRDARGHARGGHRGSGPDAAALDPMPAGVIISADGQLLGVDLGSADRRDTVGASPVMCPTSAQAADGIGQRAGRDTGHRLRSKGPRGGRDGRHHAGRDARTRTGARDDACVPALIIDSPGDPGTGLAIAVPDRIRAGGGRPGAAEDSAGLIVRGRARRALPDDGMTGERDGGVRLPRLGTSPTPG
jgi:hypothetical protein